MKKTLLLLVCFTLFGLQGFAYETTELTESEVKVMEPFDIISVITEPENYRDKLEVYGIVEPDITSYRYKDSTVMFIDFEGELQYEGSYYGDHDGSISMCDMTMSDMEYAEEYMREHFNHYGFVTYYDFNGSNCIAVDETGEKYIIKFEV